MARTSRPSLADAIAANISARGPRCSVALLLPSLAADEKADLEAALKNPVIPATAIAKGINAIGHSVSQMSVQRHRRHECSCA